jgi:hypothetical protein
MSACAPCHASPPSPSPSPSPPSRARGLSLGTAALLVLLPKCPLCFVAWAGALGLGSYAMHATMIPVLALATFCAAQTLFFSRRDRRASLVAALGVALVLVSSLLDLGAAPRLAGIAVVVLASLFKPARMSPTALR